MPAVSCTWMTTADWETLTAQDPGVFDHLAALGGDTYARTCEDGTVWLNSDIVMAFLGLP